MGIPTQVAILPSNAMHGVNVSSDSFKFKQAVYKEVVQSL